MASNKIKLLILLFCVNSIFTAPGEEFPGVLQEGELANNGETYIKYILPSGYPSQKSQKSLKIQLKDLVDQNNEYYLILEKHIMAGHAMKGLTFNIYDDNIRETTIALFKVLEQAKSEKVEIIRNWALKHINKHIVDYAYRLVSLFRNDIDKYQEPPFITKPNFYVNSETINKALKLKINNGKFDEQDARVNQFYRRGNTVTINSNYSSWNLWNSECEFLLDYFREDISLNSYYYGIHLKYPFWMNNDELTEIDPRYAEKYYYVHQQLIARYKLENEHLKHEAKDERLDKCYKDFNPYLTYDNGLPFSIRSTVLEHWNEDLARIKSIDIAIRECISRGFIYMDNGAKVTLTPDNYVDLLAKLIRANYEGPKTSKIVKALYGYGGSGYPVDRYNPAPSVLHHPETTLRDPIYWYLMESLLKYFKEYAATLDPFDLNEYQSDEFEIVDHKFSKLTTYFDYYEVNLNKVFGDIDEDDHSSLIFTARQKRLKHLPFNLEFTVSSSVNNTANVKIFLGPICDEVNCWREYSRFYELDSFKFKFEEGMNHVSWAPETSNRFSYDDFYNTNLRTSNTNHFDLFKFPENLLLPKGLDQGLNLTLFVYISSSTNMPDEDYPEPLGFPFNRPANVKLYNESRIYQNYKFFNVTIFHKEGRKDSFGQFSRHLN